MTHQCNHYGRESAFEHVFVGETVNERVIGFHNWVQLYLEESQGNFIYDDFVPDACGDSIITIDFTWKNKSKTFGSFFLGTSPEFELAIYTVCFLAGNEDGTMVTLGNENRTRCLTDKRSGFQFHPRPYQMRKFSSPESILVAQSHPVSSINS
ncbi:ENDOU [Branchiostoma lanceolatum]|uniref:Uridylate-specific endoribonuclease n=1 Tax=Branchiostoma lanceolatum TaxID=7740 RepID=A0A8K0EXS1_BRALA|nr:ENDOU [Branchiostoma lanceolatum]